MTVIIEPLGGLGNQLFVYAFGLSLAKQLQTEIHADLWRFHNYPWHRYELDSIATEISRTYSSKGREQVGRFIRVIPAAMARLGRYHSGPLNRLVTETRFTYDPRLRNVEKNTRLSGYFQSWRYFDDIADEIRNQILTVVSPSKWFYDTAQLLSGLGEWIAVHVRLGNYTKVPGMGVVSEEYYKRAIQFIESMCGKLPIVVFSDDPEVARTYGCFPSDRSIFVSTPSNTRAVEPLVLMSRAGAIVAANSTFSWWSAFIGESRNRPVVVPRPWLDLDLDTRDLFPRHWCSIGR
jgi:hypothetical protein